LNQFREIFGAIKTDLTERFGGFNLLGTLAGLIFLSGDTIWDKAYNIFAGGMDGLWHDKIPLVPIAPAPPIWESALIFLAIWIPCVAFSAPEYRSLKRRKR
jgi:hypothetical protein